MNIDSLPNYTIHPPSIHFEKSWGEERIANGKEMTMTMSMAMTMAADISMALDMEGDCTPLSLSRCNSLHLPPLLEWQRSSSRRSISDIQCSDLLEKDRDLIANVEDDHGPDPFPDPLPLITSASLDMLNLMQEYFNNDVVKEILPKTKLTFYGDRDLKIDEIGAKGADSGLKNAEEANKILCEFPLIKDSGKQDDPFTFFVSTDLKKSIGPLVENSNQNHQENDKKKKRVNIRTKRASKEKPVLKKPVLKKPVSKKPVLKKPVSKAKEPIKKTIVPSVPKDAMTKKESISVKPIAEQTDKDKKSCILNRSWDMHYRELEKFYIKNKHSCVLRSDPNTKLSGWVKRQRNNLKTGKLSVSQIERLEKLEFSWNRLEQAWHTKYDQLKVYVEKYGDSNVCGSYNRSLAEWCQRQRREFKNNKSSLTPARIQKLETLTNWSWHARKQHNEKNKEKH